MSQPVQYSKLDYDAVAKGLDARDSLEVPQRRNYDICMVFKYKTSKAVKYEEQSTELLVNRVLVEASQEEKSRMQMWKQRRESILKSLQNCGLHLFCYFSRDRDDIIVKIGASAQKLRDTAARMKYRLMLKKQYLNAYAEYCHDFPGRPERGFKDRRVISHIYQTHTDDDFPDSDAIFKTLDKIYIIDHIIKSKDKDCAGIPVGNLLYKPDGSVPELKAYFPLHENLALKDLIGETWLHKFEWIRMPEEKANQSQLGIFVFFRLTVSNIVEWSYPKLVQWWRSWYLEKNYCLSYCHGHTLLELADMSGAEQQSKREPYDAFTNFDETLITHGYATLFAVTSPWVCAATFVGTVIEIFIDMKSLCEARQRPIPTRAKTNEPWSTAFDIYGVLAASTNIILLIFASQEYDSWTFVEKLCFFVYIEHMIFLARLLLKLVFPEVPRNVELLQLKQDNMVHRCLENIKVQQQIDTSMFRDTRADNIEVFEHDLLDDDDAEPKLHLTDSAKAMQEAVLEMVRKTPSQVV